MHTFERTFSKFHNAFEQTFCKALFGKCEIILANKGKPGILVDDFRFRTNCFVEMCKERL